MAENEEAFSYCLQDVTSLYILQKVAYSEKPLDVEDLDEFVANPRGWLSVALLIRGGLLQPVGLEVRATERGKKELSMIEAYCLGSSR